MQNTSVQQPPRKLGGQKGQQGDVILHVGLERQVVEIERGHVVGFRQEMVFTARFTAIGWVRPPAQRADRRTVDDRTGEVQ